MYEIDFIGDEYIETSAIKEGNKVIVKISLKQEFIERINELQERIIWLENQ
jgi:hypothetical protein